MKPQELRREDRIPLLSYLPPGKTQTSFSYAYYAGVCERCGRKWMLKEYLSKKERRRCIYCGSKEFDVEEHIKEIPFSEEVGELLGYYTVEGYITPDGGALRFYFGKWSDRKERKNANRVATIIRRIFGYRARVRKRVQEWKGRKQYYVTVEVNNRKVIRFLQSLGCSSTRASEKRLPWVLFNTTPRVRRAFWDAYIRGDGCENKRNKLMRVSTASEKLAIDLCYLLLQDGIIASLSEYSRRGIGGISRKIYVLGFSFNTLTQHNARGVQFGDLLAVKIRKNETVESDSLIPVYDISVGEEGDTDNFVANGVVVHNSVCYLLFLEQVASDIWEATVADAPDMPRRSARFKITEGGIEDV
ncbi:MAG: LAGLIDADG family homing endonuclease [Nitrososphaerota archaeon]